MTRINVVNVSLLSDQHLLAEYKELPRIFGYVDKAIKKGLKPKDLNIPKEYVLGPGHVKFFYNKLVYIYARHAQLVWELEYRHFTLQYPQLKQNLDDYSPLWVEDYEPTKQAIQLNSERIMERFQANPKVHKWSARNKNSEYRALFT